MGFRRAIYEEDKEERRESILDAARNLLEQSDGPPPTVAKVACEAGVAKGTIYLYFRTQEEIYLALLEQEYAVWMNSVETTLLSGQPDAGEGAALDTVAAELAAYPVSRPLFLRLAHLHHAMAESIPAGALRESKIRLFQRLADLGGKLERRLGLAPGDGERLLRNTYALVLGLHQMATPPKAVRELFEEPEFQEHKLDFQSELHRALVALWRGWNARETKRTFSIGAKQ